MAIHQDRMIALIRAARAFRDTLAYIESLTIKPDVTLEELVSAISSAAASIGVQPYVTIETEYQHYKKFKRHNDRERHRQARKRADERAGITRPQRITRTTVGEYMDTPTPKPEDIFTPEYIASIEATYREGKAREEQILTPAPAPRPREVRDPNVISRSVEWGEGEVKPDDALKDLENGGSLF